MARLAELSAGEVLARLPEIESLDDESVPSLKTADLFICALGFEDRCTTIPRLLAEASDAPGVGTVICLEYNTNPIDNERNRDDLMAAFARIGRQVRTIRIDEDNFLGELEAAVAAAVGSAQSQLMRVVMDISVMANRAIMKCLTPVAEADVELTIVYTEAEEYLPRRAEFVQTNTGPEQGLTAIVSPTHPGNFHDPLPASVILSASFNRDRCRGIVIFVDQTLVMTRPTDRVHWLVGRPHLAKDDWRLAAVATVNELGPHDQQHTVTTFGYKEMVQTLEDLYGDLQAKYNVTVSPNGSKLQALGTWLFWYMHQEVRIVVAAPERYDAANYSRGARALWKIRLGRTGELCELLARVGELRVDD
jgi:hypothetical protein